MTRDKIKGKMTLKFEDRKEDGKELVGIELDETAMIEIANFIDGFYVGKESSILGTSFVSPEFKLANQIINRYTNGDDRFSRDQFYNLICEKLKDFLE